MPLLSPHLDFTDTTTSPSPSPSAAAAAALPPPGTHLVVSDTLTASSAFVVYHFVGAAKAAKVPTIWVDLRTETPTSLDAALRRLGTSLPASPQFTTISPSPLPRPLGGEPYLFDPTPSLMSTFGAVRNALSSLPSPPLPTTPTTPTPSALIILDGLSELGRSGFSSVEITRFVRAVLALSDAAVVSTLHADHLPKTPDAADTESADGDLLPRLLRFADAWWRVSGLATGRSGDVSGEISCHHVGTKVGPSVRRENPLQFRLEVGGVKVFPKGTGRGFL